MSCRLALLLALLPAAAVAAELPAAGTMPAGGEGATAADGIVRSFTLGSDGRVNGLLLDDGAEVHVARSLAGRLEAIVKTGDTVRVQGWRSPTPGVLIANAVTDARTGKAVVAPAFAGRGPDQGVTPGRPPPGATEATLEGRVLQPLHAADGQTDGALLGDGTQLRLPAGAAARMGKLLEPGEPIAAEGYEMHTPHGDVMSVEAIGASPESLTQVAPEDPAETPQPDTPGPSKPPGQ